MRRERSWTHKAETGQNPQNGCFVPTAMHVTSACVVPGAGIEPARGFPQGIFVPLQLSPLHARRHAFVVWTLPLPSRTRASRARIRQGPSSLYTFLGGARCVEPRSTTCSQVSFRHLPRKCGALAILRTQTTTTSRYLCAARAQPHQRNQGLARYCSHPDVLLFHRI